MLGRGTLPLLSLRFELVWWWRVPHVVDEVVSVLIIRSTTDLIHHGGVIGQVRHCGWREWPTECCAAEESMRASRCRKLRAHIKASEVDHVVLEELNGWIICLYTEIGAKHELMSWLQQLTSLL